MFDRPWIGILISLKYRLKIIKDYIIKRPWINLINTDSLNLSDLYMKNGFLNYNFVKEAMYPLLEAKNLSKNITLLEFYKYNNIDIHLYTTCIKKGGFKKIDLSYKTHPNLLLIKALNMSLSIPILFEPVMYKKILHRWRYIK